MCLSKFLAVTDLSIMPLLPPQDEEYARYLQCELYAMSDEPDRGGEFEVTVPLHQEPVTERVSDIWNVGIMSDRGIYACTHVVTLHSDQ